MVAIVNGCFPREVHAEGEEKVEHPQLLPQLLGVFWVMSTLKKKQFSIEHVIQCVLVQHRIIQDVFCELADKAEETGWIVLSVHWVDMLDI